MDTSSNHPNTDHHVLPSNIELSLPVGAEPGAPSQEETHTPAEVEVVAQADTSIPPPPAAAALSLSLMDRYWKLALIAILVVAIALRTRGLNWDEGQHLHPDERFLTMVETAIRLPTSLGQYFDTASSPLNPYNNNFGTFVYGTAPLFFVRLVSELTGLTEYDEMVLLGRALSALADVFAVAMVFFLGRRLYGLRVGLLAALLYALSVLPIKQSHFFTVDTFTNIPLLLAFWFTLDIAEGKQGKWAFLLAGACYGLMLASRINLVIFFGIILLAAALQLLKSVQHIGVSRVSQSPVPIVPVAKAEISEPVPMRTFRVGPLLIEIEFKPETRLDSQSGALNQPAESSSGIRPHLVRLAAGLAILGVAAILAFRIAQPYAFDGLFRLNPQFLDDMGKAQRLVSGQDDYPPSHQWTSRTPHWFPWYNMVVWGFGPALGITAWLGVGLSAYYVLRRQQWHHLLILLWVTGMFFYHGQQFVKTMRYFLPLYPFLTIFAAFFLFTMWGQAKALEENVRHVRLARSARFFAAIFFGIVIGMTFYWAMASASIYTRSNTRVAASRWIFANVTDAEVIGSEHWDDVLPLRVDGKDYYGEHEGVMLELYAEETPEKREKMVEWMDQVDYIITSSNRLYDSIPRLPMRFPLTTKYYEWLFNGELGFEKVQEFTSYPQFLGITVMDDHAEEAFSVYDHPKVTIFKKTSAYSHDNTVKLFNSVDLTEVLRLKPIDAAASRRQFRMTPVDLAANRTGGTWTDLFNPNDLANRFPVPIWLLMVWGVGALTFPLTFVTFRAFADRGYAFAKALGILFVSWIAWTLSSYHLLPFGRLPILIGITILAASSFLLGRKHWQELRTYIKTNLTILLVVELVFFVFFAMDLAIRIQNPDLWHPWLGGERPMDVAFLNAIVKTTYFPPYNPWFAGSYINYYYFGQLISAVLVRLSGIVPEVAYNLLIPLFFGLTASGVFGVVFNLVFYGRQRLQPEAELPGEVTPPGLLLPSVAGVFGIVLVLIIGNLGQLKLAAKGLTELGSGSFAGGLSKWLLAGEDIPIRIGDWYWTATRVIPNTINEFPFFTFIYGDLHAHLIAIPYTLIALGLAAHILLNRDSLRWHDLGVIALVLGALRAINTWDYPTYLGIIGAALMLKWSSEQVHDKKAEAFDWQDWLQQWLRFGVILFFVLLLTLVPMNIIGISVNVELAIYILLLLFGVFMGLYRLGRFWNPYSSFKSFSWQFLPLLILSIGLFLPYILNYATGYVSVEVWKDTRTTFSQYLTVHGIFLFLITTFFVVTLLTDTHEDTDSSKPGMEVQGWALYLGPLMIVAVVMLVYFKLPVAALVFLLITAGAWIILGQETSTEMRWTATLMCVGLLLTLIVELIVLKGDIGRMNTVFKFYLQAWVLFGIASAVGLGLMFEHLALKWKQDKLPEAAVTDTPSRSPFPASTSRTIRWVWWGALSLLMLAGLLYPVAAARAKMNDRYVQGTPPSLNGMDYMTQGATYNEKDQQLELRWDYEAIEWIRQNIKGSPVIMEGNTGLYRWGNRYSIYTGLPTVIGWDWHTKQQYSLLPGDLVDYRLNVVREFYDTTNQARALEIARRYDISYVIVGSLEHAVYDANGLSKFDQGEFWLPVYQNEQVKIYEVQ